MDGEMIAAIQVFTSLQDNESGAQNGLIVTFLAIWLLIMRTCLQVKFEETDYLGGSGIGPGTQNEE